MQYLTAPPRLAFPKGLGPFCLLTALTFPTLLFGGVLYYWLSSVLLVRNLECCQMSLWGWGPGKSGVATSQNSMALKWSGCVDLGDVKTELGSVSILERNWVLFYHSTDKELNFLKYYIFSFVRTRFILSCELVRNMMELSSTRFFCCCATHSYKQCYFGGREWVLIPKQISSSVTLKQC